MLPIAGGILLGASAGFAVSFALKVGTFPTFEKVVGLRGLCASAGGIVGIVIAILALMRIESGNAESGMPHNFNSINGMGSGLIGEWEKRDDGSYMTTEWLTMLWIPIFPVCTYRVMRMAEPNLIYMKRYMV